MQRPPKPPSFMPLPLRFPILKDLGLNESEASIYEILLEKGPTRPPELVEPSGLGRGNVYNVLQELVKKGLVQLKEGDKLQTYEAVDPGKLKTLLTQRIEQVSQLESRFGGDLQLLSTLYNHSTGKPTVQVFEGISGQKLALQDILESKTEVLTYIDVAALDGPLAQLDRWYDQKRIAKEIKTRILIADTPENRAAFKEPSAFMEVRVLSGYPSGFRTAVEIYDNTLAYFTLTKDRQIAVVLKDPVIYDMQKRQFEFLWNQAASLTLAG